MHGFYKKDVRVYIHTYICLYTCMYIDQYMYIQYRPVGIIIIIATGLLCSVHYSRVSCTR